ncbi:unnamed protein product [Fraxinus pennsylvanica]|uniref:Uncharacterized protein n=1 Tax=Fraxinus pennsylvanica TaxID=56036 RepID=A0AAD2DNJ5_9LAMI|nr:unnamed protein product [Fraxinus pennsylvanica]
MFKVADELDSDAILFMNDYHIKDVQGTRSSPEKYIEHILDIKEQSTFQGNRLTGTQRQSSWDNLNAEEDINDGKRYLNLKQEWLSHALGYIDEQVHLRKFHGFYEVEIVTPSKKVTKTFVVDKGDKPLVISPSL